MRAASAVAETAPPCLLPDSGLFLDPAFSAYRAGHEVIVFGAGRFGRLVLSALRGRDIDIRRVADNDPARWGTDCDGATVTAPRKLGPNTFVVVASAWRDDIARQLTAEGLVEGRHFVLADPPEFSRAAAPTTISHAGVPANTHSLAKPPALDAAAPRWCPVCRTGSERFLGFGVTPREDARCPHCQSLERHRLLWMYFQARTTLLDGRAKRVLHVAPEHCFEPRLRALFGRGYVTTDLFAPKVDLTTDVTRLPFVDGAFDVVLCSHVLEHVPDDLQAMREFRRVLKPDGWAILLVPITAPSTVEDPSVTTDHDRLRLFGQKDHVRRYGPDYVERLAAAGFSVTTTRRDALCAPCDTARLGVARFTGEIFSCRTSATAQ